MQYLHINLTSLFNTITYGSQLNTEHSTTQNKESVKFQTANKKEVSMDLFYYKYLSEELLVF